ncbi:MAG: hypothetical protein Q4F42_06370 [Rikenellaceae bacterium]|nr:hypothetical protein [Rikenellaceae bacterium]
MQNSKFYRVVLSLAVVCAVGLAFVASAQIEGNVRPSNAPRISGRFEPDSIGIGDRFTYSIEVEKDLVQTVIFPNFAASAGEQFELIEDVPVDTLERDGRRLKLRKSFRLAAFQEGVQRILPQVMYADKNIIDTLYGEDTLSLLVTTFEIDSTSHSIFDIKPQKTLPFRFGEISGYLMWSLVALVVLAIGLYVAYRIMRHYGKSLSDIFHPAPPMPPHEEAFRALERLYVLRLCQHDKHKLYYSTLTDILRRYIAARFEVGAMEMTSDEIIAAMRDVELPKKAAMDMADVLRAADLVKFAKAIPESEENEASYQAVWDFVELTKPVEEQPTEEE